MIRQQNSTVADGDSLTLIEVQTNSNIPLQQNLIQIKVLTLQFYEHWAMWKMQKKSLKLLKIG